MVVVVNLTNQEVAVQEDLAQTQNLTTAISMVEPVELDNLLTRVATLHQDLEC